MIAANDRGMGVSPSPTFDAWAWLCAFTEAGGGYALASSRKLWLVVDQVDVDNLTPLMAALTSGDDRVEAVRNTIERRQCGGGGGMTALHISGGARPLPIDILLAAIPSLPHAALNALVDRAIDRMDQDDGDSDIEANGDDLDGTGGEDDFIDQCGRVGSWDGPGCPISDPDFCVDDDGEDDSASDL